MTTKRLVTASEFSQFQESLDKFYKKQTSPSSSTSGATSIFTSSDHTTSRLPTNDEAQRETLSINRDESLEPVSMKRSSSVVDSSDQWQCQSQSTDDQWQQQQPLLSEDPSQVSSPSTEGSTFVPRDIASSDRSDETLISAHNKEQITSTNSWKSTTSNSEPVVVKLCTDFNVFLGYFAQKNKNLDLISPREPKAVQGTGHDTPSYAYDMHNEAPTGRSSEFAVSNEPWSSVQPSGERRNSNIDATFEAPIPTQELEETPAPSIAARGSAAACNPKTPRVNPGSRNVEPWTNFDPPEATYQLKNDTRTPTRPANTDLLVKGPVNMGSNRSTHVPSISDMTCKGTGTRADIGAQEMIDLTGSKWFKVARRNDSSESKVHSRFAPVHGIASHTVPELDRLPPLDQGETSDTCRLRLPGVKAQLAGKMENPVKDENPNHQMGRQGSVINELHKTAKNRLRYDRDFLLRFKNHTTPPQGINSIVEIIEKNTLDASYSTTPVQEASAVTAPPQPHQPDENRHVLPTHIQFSSTTSAGRLNPEMSARVQLPFHPQTAFKRTHGEREQLL
ncbi:hypothetical protein BGZ65_005530, partial [Modicella reniformis]